MIRSVLLHRLTATDIIRPEFRLLLSHVADTSFLQTNVLKLKDLLDALPASLEKAHTEALLIKLGRSSRLLNCRAVHGADCGPEYSAAELAAADIVIGGNATDGLTIPGLKVVPIEQYPYSDAAREITSRSYTRARSTRADWENNILRDITKRALSISLIDRYIGTWSVSFVASLDWLLPVLRTYCPGVPLNIYTFVRHRETADEMRKWLSARGATLHIRRERDFPHARYLVTDKFGLLVERGFDLDDRGAVEASEVWLVDDASTVLATVQSLRAYTPELR